MVKRILHTLETSPRPQLAAERGRPIHNTIDHASACWYVFYVLLNQIHNPGRAPPKFRARKCTKSDTCEAQTTSYGATNSAKALAWRQLRSNLRYQILARNRILTIRPPTRTNAPIAKLFPLSFCQTLNREENCHPFQICSPTWLTWTQDTTRTDREKIKIKIFA